MSRVLLVAALSVLALAGCGGTEKPAVQPPATPSPGPTTVTPVAYASLTEFRHAVVTAGYRCEDWVQDNSDPGAAESGHCSGDDVFATYATPEDRADAIEEYKKINKWEADEDIDPNPVLFGPNWSLSGLKTNIYVLRVKIGGEILK